MYVYEVPASFVVYDAYRIEYTYNRMLARPVAPIRVFGVPLACHLGAIFWGGEHLASTLVVQLNRHCLSVDWLY